MIAHILKMLSIDNFYGESDNIDIAKGKNQIPTSFNKAIKKIKREWKKR